MESAVKFLFNLDVNVCASMEGGEEKENCLVSRNDILLAAKAEVRAAAEAKANEGKKPTKGEAAPGAHVDDASLTAAFCQSLPQELQRKCLSAQALLHPRSRRRGFVLDVWDGKLVTDLTSLGEALNAARGDSSGGPLFISVDLVVEMHVRSLS